MRQLMPLTACIFLGAASLGASSARADVTLLSLINPTDQTTTHYSFDLTATATTTTISFGGYQKLDFEYVSEISVTPNAGGNLLGPAWKFRPAAVGSDAWTLPDGTSVPALWFAGLASEYDTFSQTFNTTPGAAYVLDFDFTSSLASDLLSPSLLSKVSEAVNSSAILVTTTALAPSVPEPSTWIMTVIGVAGLGVIRHRRRARPDPSCA